MLSSGVLLPESRLILGEEVRVVLHQPGENHTLKQPHDDTSNADETVGRRIRLVTLFEDGESVGLLPLIGDDAELPR
jgi:hypothetical protein